MNDNRSSFLLVASDRLYAYLLRALPGEFRHEYGREMAQVFRACCRRAYRDHGSWGIMRLWLLALSDLVVTATEERIEAVQDQPQGGFLPQLSYRRHQQHTNLIGWVYLLGHALFLLISSVVYVYIMLATGSAAAGEAPAMIVLTLLTLLAVPGILAGYGLLQRRRWARAVALLVALLELQTYPIGTIFGLYTFWILLQPPATGTFAPGISVKA